MGGIGAKRSKKSKSNRQTLKQKYKVIRKVKEHHKKKRKEANKMKRAGIKPKEAKDPGIPNSWPFKEELVAQMKAQQERAEAKQLALKEARRAERQVRVGQGGRAGCSGAAGGALGPACCCARAAARRLAAACRRRRPVGRCLPLLPQAAQQAAAMDAEGRGPGLEAMQRAANKRGREFERTVAAAAAAPGSAAYQDYSRRSFFKEFVKVRWPCDVVC